MESIPFPRMVPIPFGRELYVWQISTVKKFFVESIDCCLLRTNDFQPEGFRVTRLRRLSGDCLASSGNWSSAGRFGLLTASGMWSWYIAGVSRAESRGN